MNHQHQKDGVAMGSPLGPALSNIFVGFMSINYLSAIKSPLRISAMQMTLLQFWKSECDIFLPKLKSLHRFLKFTFKRKEKTTPCNLFTFFWRKLNLVLSPVSIGNQLLTAFIQVGIHFVLNKSKST